MFRNIFCALILSVAPAFAAGTEQWVLQEFPRFRITYRIRFIRSMGEPRRARQGSLP
jgi:hypothetical protein